MKPFFSAFIQSTPKLIKFLICLTAGASLLVSVFRLLLPHVYAQSHLLDWIGLSWQGLRHGHLWQILTHLFILPASNAFITNTLFSVLFNGCLLWVVGTALAGEIGTLAFLRLYLFSGIVGGTCAAFCASFGGSYQLLLGPLGAIYACMFVWNMYFADLKLRLFFILAIKARALLLCLLGLSVLETISTGQWAAALALLLSVLCGYVYAVCAWGLQSPYPITARFDRRLHSLYQKTLRAFKAVPMPATDSKIFDIRTGRPYANDDAFMDAMLDKVNSSGQRSLSWREKRRMRRISRNIKRTTR